MKFAHLICRFGIILFFFSLGCKGLDKVGVQMPLTGDSSQRVTPSDPATVDMGAAAPSDCLTVFTKKVEPILEARCVQCHDNSPSNLHLKDGLANAPDNYTMTLQFISQNPNAPWVQNSILAHPTRSVLHPLQVFDEQSQEFKEIKDWIDLEHSGTCN